MKKLKSKIVSKTFYKFVFSYFTVFVIPLAVSFLFFNYYYMGTYSREVYQNQMKQTETIQKSMDIQLRQIQNIINQIRYENEFKKWYLSNDFNKISTYRKIKGYTLLNDFIKEIIFIEPSLSICISSKNTFLLKEFDRYYANEDTSKSNFSDQILEPKKNKWISFQNILFGSEEVKSVLTYVVPLSTTQGSNGIIAILIDKEKFIEALAVSIDEKSNIFVLDETRNYIFSALQGGKNSEVINMGKARITTDKNTYGEFINNKYVTYSFSEVENWQYINILPAKIVNQKMRDLQTKYILISILMFFIGCIIVYYFSRKTYNPISKLLDVVKKNYEQPVLLENEFEIAINAFSSLSQSSERMKEMIKKSLLQNLIKGSYKSIDEFNRESKQYHTNFSGGLFFVVVVKWNEQIELKDLDSNVFLIESYLKEICEASGFGNFEANQGVFICAKENFEQKVLYKSLNNIANEFKLNFNKKIAIGVSSANEEIGNINRLYIEAIFSLENIEKERKGIVCFYGEEQRINLSVYPSEEILKIKQTLIELDVDRFQSMMTLLIETINSSKLSMFMRVCAFYDITNTIIKTLAELDSNALIKLKRYNVILSEKNTSINRLSEILTQLSFDTIEYMKEVTNYDEASLIEKIESYINLNLFEDDFSINNLADHFSMSSSSISQIYKKSSGRILSAYIAEKKIDYAKELLKKDTKMDEVIKQLGYSNDSSFIRWFKRQTGVTPGEFKKIYK